MFVHVVLTEDLREDWTCPTEPPLKIKSLLLLLLLLLLHGRVFVMKVSGCLKFTSYRECLYLPFQSSSYSCMSVGQLP